MRLKFVGQWFESGNQTWNNFYDVIKENTALKTLNYYWMYAPYGSRSKKIQKDQPRTGYRTVKEYVDHTLKHRATIVIHYDNN